MILDDRTTHQLKKDGTHRKQGKRMLTLGCDVCGNVYEKPFWPRVADVKHFCSSKCMYGNRCTDGKHDHVTRECESCKKQLRRNKKYTTKWGWFCSYKYYGMYRSLHPETYKASLAAMQTSEVQQRAARTRKTRIESGQSKHPRLGTQHSDETK